MDGTDGPRAPSPRVNVDARVRGAVLDAVSADLVLVGTVRSLARGFGVTVWDLRSCLRELLDAGWIVVQLAPGGRLTIRLERRSY
jgi:hypothetical protein